METRAHYVLIGAFMLGGIVLAILFTLWLGSNRSEYDEYQIIFTQKISGLQEGANVLFNGIPVGQVETLELDQTNPNRSLALVRVDKGTPVKTDTGVELELTGVTGLAVVQFNGGSANAPLLKDVSRERVPVIEAELGGIAAVLESSGDLALSLQQLLSQENAESVSRVLEDIEAITDVIADKETELALIIDNAAVASTELRLAAKNISSATDSLNRTMTTIDEVVRSDAQVAIKEMTTAATNLNKLVLDVSAIVDESAEPITEFTRQGLGATVTMIHKASRLVDTTEAILLELDRNPAAFLVGEGRPTAE